MKMKSFAFASTLLAASLMTSPGYSDFLFFKTHPLPKDIPSPWFTGPLLAPSGHVIPPDHANIEPYVYCTVNTGKYDTHWNSFSTPNFYSGLFQLPIQIGLCPRLDFQFTPQVFYNETQGEHTVGFGDIPVGFDIQLLSDTATGWWPAIRLSLKANIPLGSYQKLDPNKLGTDAIGAGSWIPAVALVFSRLFHIKDLHYINGRLAFNYSVPTPVHVRGFNTYGGGFGTAGTAYPGNNFSVDFGFEYSLTQRWVIASDFLYAHSNKDRFSGSPGTLSIGGSPASVTNGSSEQFSLAPALEYNWNANVGIIGGVWFTVAGRNVAQFASGIIALNIYI